MIADRRRGLVGTFRGQPAPSPGLTIAGAGVSGESWQLTAILHRQSKRPVKWGSDALSKKRATTPTWSDCNGFWSCSLA